MAQSEVVTGLPSYECPTCRKLHTVAEASEAPFRPFCCERCKMVDLGRWLDGTYVVSESTQPETSDGLDGDPPPGDEGDRRDIVSDGG